METIESVHIIISEFFIPAFWGILPIGVLLGMAFNFLFEEFQN